MKKQTREKNTLQNCLMYICRQTLNSLNYMLIAMEIYMFRLE